MNNNDFDRVVRNRITKINSVLLAKGKEYGTEDRLHNFKVAAKKLGTTPMKALQGMLVKHEVSVEDMINGDLEITRENIQEKIGDCINYYILLEGLMEEEIEAPFKEGHDPRLQKFSDEADA